MLRDKNLIPLSHQHQHALALCVRIERASPVGVTELEAWQEKIAEIAQNEIRIHFGAEEQLVFPAALRFAELRVLVEELLAEHARLREDFAEAETRTLSPERLLGLARGLSSHIRKEERRLFERMQELMTTEELADLGARLEGALKDASQACALPNATTKPRGKK